MSSDAEKRAKLEEYLGVGFVFIHFDGESTEVDIPESLRGSTNVTLKLSHYFSGALALEEERVFAELLFPEGPYTCSVPYSAIWGITPRDEQTIVWTDKVPAEVLKGLQAQEDVKGEEKKAEQKESAETDSEEGDEKKEKPSKNRVFPHLRRVK